MDAMVEQLGAVWRQAVSIWLSGGWAMIAIAINAVFLFAIGTRVMLRLREKGFGKVSEKRWRRWIDHPEQRRGPIGQMLDFVTGAHSLHELGVMFEELRATQIVPFQRDLKVMKICVSAAPLFGLLGTVTGMLVTFGAMATGTGGDKTMNEIAGGISEALITTETGLVVAIPGLFFQYQMTRQLERYKAFLAHLQTVCTQDLYRKMNRKKAA